MKTAVVVGINDYPGTHSDKAYHKKAADAWRRVLRSRGFAVVTFYDGAATRENVEKTWPRLKPGDAGAVVLVMEGGEPGDRGVWLYDGLWLPEDLNRLAGRRPSECPLTVIVDACAAGSMYLPSKGLRFWASCHGNEYSRGHEVFAAGTVFTARATRMLSPWPTNGELYRRVRASVAKDYWYEQTPRVRFDPAAARQPFLG